jgi:hypothetical protein
MYSDNNYLIAVGQHRKTKTILHLDQLVDSKKSAG